MRDPALEIEEVLAERRVVRREDGRDEPGHRLLVPGTRVQPARDDFGLAHGLLHVRDDALAILPFAVGVHGLERPRSEEGLVEQVLLVPAGVRVAIDHHARAAIESGPAGRRLFPRARDFGEHIDPRPDVLAALGVVRRGGRHRVRPLRGARRHPLVQRLRRDAELVRFASHLVERDEPVVVVECRILDALGRHRARHLLELADELHVLVALARQDIVRLFQEQVAHEVEDRRRAPEITTLCLRHRMLHIPTVTRVHLTVAIGHVRPVDREAGDDLAHGMREARQREVAIVTAAF